jgi:hypothetical protein
MRISPNFFVVEKSLVPELALKSVSRGVSHCVVQHFEIQPWWGGACGVGARMSALSCACTPSDTQS